MFFKKNNLSRLELSKGLCLGAIFLFSLTFLGLLKFKLYSMWDLTIPPFDPALQMEKVFYLWDHSFLGGRYYVLLWNYPVFLFSFICQQLGFSIEIGYSLLHWALFFLAGVGMFFFLENIIAKKSGLARMASLLGALLYMFNPFMIFRLNSTFYTLYIIAFLPWILLLARKALFAFSKDRLNFIVYSLGVVLLSVLMMPGLSNIPVGFITALFCGVYICALAVFFKKIKALASFVLLITPLLLLVHAWWFAPNFMHSAVKEAIHREGQYQNDTMEGIESWSNKKSLSYYNLFRNQVYLDQESQVGLKGGELWVENSDLFSSNLFVMLSFLVPVIVFWAIFKTKDLLKIEGLFFIAILLLLFPLFALLRAPFGEIMYLIFLKVPFYILRRPPSYMFLVSFAYACLFGFATFLIFRKNKLEKPAFGGIKISAGFIFSLFVLLIVFSSYTQFLGASSYMNLMSGNGEIKEVSSTIKVPDYAKETVAYLNGADKDGGAIVFPRSGMLRGYEWEDGYFGWDYYYLSLNRPVLSSAIDRYSMFYFYQYLDDYLMGRTKNENLALLLSKLNIRYILVTEDFLRHTGSGSFDIEKINHKLKHTENISLSKVFGKVKVYENKLCDTMCYDFYLPAKALPIRADQQKDIFLNFEDSEIDYLETENELSFAGLENKKKNVSLESVDKISPTHYNVKLKFNKKESLVLSSRITYDKGWIASAPDLKTQHVKINNQFNGWIVTKNSAELPDTAELKVYFKPQQLSERINLVSLSSLAIVTISFIFLLGYKKTKNGQNG